MKNTNKYKHTDVYFVEIKIRKHLVKSYVLESNMQKLKVFQVYQIKPSNTHSKNTFGKIKCSTTICLNKN